MLVPFIGYALGRRFIGYVECEGERLTDMLNDVDWHELGFVCDGRYLFGQRSLENSLLPEDFSAYEVGGIV